MSKKGVQMGWETILTIVVLSVLAVVLFGIWRPTAGEVGTFFSSETLKAKDSACLLSGQRDLERGVKLQDRDEDRRPDYCDGCFSYTNKQGNNEEDGDGDGVPTYCDKDESIDKGRTIVTCKSGFTITDDGRCIEGAAPSAKKVG